jgi:hypothetical protein
MIIRITNNNIKKNCYNNYNKFLLQFYTCNRNVINKERQGFGSFHSEDLDLLISKDENEYRSMYSYGYPLIYHDIKDIIDQRFQSSLELASSSSTSSSLLYGKACKDNLFVLDDDWV